jgi:two-component system, LuxR family, sensor kinase FixL
MTTSQAEISEALDARTAKRGESVFHKMRNTLNSIHVSAGLIHQRIRKFHVDDVGRVADLLEAHSHDYGWYLTQDPRGKMIPHFLGRLSEELGQNHSGILAELATLNEYLDQLELLVTAGQTPHRVGGFKETIQFATVMEEALAPHQGELDRMGVKVLREYQNVGEGILEASKLLRILVQLIRNSMNAMREIADQPHQLTLYVLPCPDREEFVRLQVADTGIGISPDCLTQVFSPQMPGGQAELLPNLHASAIAAKELAGSLRVWSDGPNQGAIFTLDVPVIHMEGER